MKRREIVRRLQLEPHQLRLLEERVQPNSLGDIVWLCQHADPSKLEGYAVTMATTEGDETEWAAAVLALEEGTEPFEVALQKLYSHELPVNFWESVLKAAREHRRTRVEQLAVQKMAEQADSFGAWHAVYHEAKDSELYAVRQTALEKMLELMGSDPIKILTTYGDTEPGSAEGDTAAKTFCDLHVPVPVLLMFAVAPVNDRAGDLLLDVILKTCGSVAVKVLASQAILDAEAFRHRKNLKKVSRELLDEAWLEALKAQHTPSSIAVYDAFPPSSPGRKVIYDHFAAMENMPPEAWIDAYESSDCGTPLHALFLQRALASVDDAVAEGQPATT